MALMLSREEHALSLFQYLHCMPIPGIDRFVERFPVEHVDLSQRRLDQQIDVVAQSPHLRITAHRSGGHQDIDDVRRTLSRVSEKLPERPLIYIVDGGLEAQSLETSLRR